jgi:hypothetical protein
MACMWTIIRCIGRDRLIGGYSFKMIERFPRVFHGKVLKFRRAGLTTEDPELDEFSFFRLNVFFVLSRVLPDGEIWSTLSVHQPDRSAMIALQLDSRYTVTPICKSCSWIPNGRPLTLPPEDRQTSKLPRRQTFLHPYSRVVMSMTDSQIVVHIVNDF